MKRIVTIQDQKWSNYVKERDNYTCRRCGSNKDIDKVNVESHHVKNYHQNEEYRLNLDNGICLCEECHKHITRHQKKSIPEKNGTKFVDTFLEIDSLPDNDYIKELSNSIE